MSKRRYTEHQFRTAIADPTVRTVADLCRSLGLVPRGANYETLRIYARRLSIDVDHVLRSRRDRVARTEAVHAPRCSAKPTVLHR